MLGGGQRVEVAAPDHQSLQGLEADPASAEWATAAAAQAKAGGREDLAFQLLGEAAQRRKAESAAAAKQEQADLDNRRKTINTLPQAQKFSIIANDPEAAGKLYNLKGKALDNFVQDARDSLATIRDKNRAELSKLRPVNPANVTKGDIAQVQGVLGSKDIDVDSFDTDIWGDGADTYGQFSEMLADQARTEQELRAKRGETATLDQITSELVDTLQANGTFQTSEGFMGFGGGVNVQDDFSADNVRSVFKGRTDALQPTGGTQAPPSVNTQSAPAAVAPPTVDFDFTN